MATATPQQIEETGGGGGGGGYYNPLPAPNAPTPGSPAGQYDVIPWRGSMPVERYAPTDDTPVVVPFVQPPVPIPLDEGCGGRCGGGGPTFGGGGSGAGGPILGGGSSPAPIAASRAALTLEEEKTMPKNWLWLALAFGAGYFVAKR